MVIFAEPQTGTKTYTVDADAADLIAAYNSNKAQYADTPLTFLTRRGYGWEYGADLTTPEELMARKSQYPVVAVWNGTAQAL